MDPAETGRLPVGEERSDSLTRRARWKSVAVATAAVVTPMAIGLWSTAYPHVVEAAFDRLTAAVAEYWPLVLLFTAAAGLAGLLPGAALLARARRESAVLKRLEESFSSAVVREDAYLIRTEDVDDRTPGGEPVAGLPLRYLESPADSADVTVFQSGIGLDARDFRPAMQLLQGRHTVALTQLGFDKRDSADPSFRPASLDTSALTFLTGLDLCRRLGGGRPLRTVLFSSAADLLLYAAVHYPDRVRELGMSEAVLLDPNVNRRTTTISRALADSAGRNRVKAMLEVVNSAAEAPEHRQESLLRHYCRYAAVNLDKDLERVVLHATDIARYWDVEGHVKFLDHLGALCDSVPSVRVVLSGDNLDLATDLLRSARRRGLHSTVRAARGSHFEMLDPEYVRALVDSP